MPHLLQDAQAWLTSAVRGVSSSSLTRQVHVTDEQKEAFVRKMMGWVSLCGVWAGPGWWLGSQRASLLPSGVAALMT